MKENNLEIERKFLIRRPALASLDRIAERTEIEQTYLLASEVGVSERVRRRGLNGRFVFTHTEKKRLTDMTRVELEREISPEEYERFLLRADPERITIRKTRFCLPYEGQLFEIDLFPFWQNQAFMEIELEREEQDVVFPPWIEIVREITSDGRYTNSALAKHSPDEEIPSAPCRVTGGIL